MNTIKILGKIKNRFGDDAIILPDDIWINSQYRIRKDSTGEWEKIESCYGLAMASVIELGIIENKKEL